jgi:hypothetical protein
MFGSDSRADRMARYFNVHPQDAQPHRIAQVMVRLRGTALVCRPYNLLSAGGRPDAVR